MIQPSYFQHKINHLMLSLSPGSGRADDDEKISRGPNSLRCFVLLLLDNTRATILLLAFEVSGKHPQSIQQPDRFVSSQQSQRDSATISFQLLFFVKNNAMYSIILNYTS